MTESEYPLPDVITIDEHTDMSKIADIAFDASSKKRVRRQAVGFKIFRDEIEFIKWQTEEPREIFEITPTIASNMINNGSPIHVRIFVTYGAGIIDN